MLKKLTALAVGATASLAPGVADADIVFNASGFSAKNVAVSARATFSFTEEKILLTLENTSLQSSLNPDDTVASFYFTLNDNQELSGYSAFGDVYKGNKSGSDTLVEENADLRAMKKKSGKWMLKPMDQSQAPFGNYGLGTVGNSGLGGNGFNGSIVGNLDYSIFAGDITTRNLDKKKLVKESIDFSFDNTILNLSENDIGDTVVFGLGTAPDSLLYGTSAVPEPSSLLSIVFGFLGLSFFRKRRTI